MSPSSLKNITWEIRQKNLIIRSDWKLRILSSAVLNPELDEADTIINHQIPQNFRTRDYRGHLRTVVQKLGLNPDSTIGLLTAARIENVAIKTLTYNNLTVTAFVTGGLSNPASAGDKAARKRLGTINIIVLTNGRVTNSCLVNIVQTATEAKVLALRRLDVRSRFSQRPATGTTSDAIVVASNMAGPPQNYAGTATPLGELIGKTVYDAVKETLQKSQGFQSNRSLKKRLEEYGITIDDLVRTWRELYLHHPSMGNIKDIEKLASIRFKSILSDINVASLIIAGLRLQEDGENQNIPFLTKDEFKNDPIHLVADEILGLAVADYIAGSRGVFEFYRFDRRKPGILKKLGPFTDDVIGGLIGGVSSTIYTQLLDKKG